MKTKIEILKQLDEFIRVQKDTDMQFHYLVKAKDEEGIDRYRMEIWELRGYVYALQWVLTDYLCDYRGEGYKIENKK